MENGDSVSISGAGSAWHSLAAVRVGGAGTGNVAVSGGAAVTNTTTRIGFTAGSHGTVTVDGLGTTWDSSDGIEVGSEVGQGTLAVTGGGHFTTTATSIGEFSEANGAVTISGPGSMLTDSDKLEVGVIGVGELQVLTGGTVSAAAAFIARDAGSSGTVEVTGAGAALSTTGAMYVGGSALATGGTATLAVTAGGNVTAGTLLKVWQNGSITVNGATSNYPALEMAGGMLTQATIDLTGKTASGFGTLNGIVTGSGTVTASGGTLTLGDPASTAGVSLTGTLDVGTNAHAVLLDADRVDLGMTTTLAQGAQLSAANGYSLGSGKTLTATGGATVHGAFTNGGIINGPVAAGTLLSFAGDVDGAGLFTGNIQFAGEFSPGTSPATVSIAGNVTFAPTATLRIEISGTTFGSLDQVVVSGQATLGGTLDVDLINGFQPALGGTFTVMTFLSRSGDFATYTDTLLTGHLALKPQFTPNSLVLKARPAQDGDINLDGTVNIFDVNAVSSNWGTAGPQGDVNGDGIVNIFDVNEISANWGASGGGSAAAVPEPSTAALTVLAAIGCLAMVPRSRRAAATARHADWTRVEAIHVTAEEQPPMRRVVPPRRKQQGAVWFVTALVAALVTGNFGAQSHAPAATLTGAYVVSTTQTGNNTPSGMGSWDTVGGNGTWNIWLNDGGFGGPFINGPDDDHVDLNIPQLLGRHSYTFQFTGGDIGVQYFGLNLFFDGGFNTPGISAFAHVSTSADSNTPFFSNSALQTPTLLGGVVAGSGKLFLVDGQVTTILTQYRIYLPAVFDQDRISPFTTVPDNTPLNEFLGQLAFLVTLADVNHDGAVNIFDVNLVSVHWGESGPTGDANGDGAVNIFDINAISSDWTGGGGSATAAVPEPSTVALAISAAALLIMRRRGLPPANGRSSPIG